MDASVTALWGKVSWQLGAREYLKVAPQDKPHKKVTGRDTGQKHEGTDQETIYRISWGQSFPGWRLVGFQARHRDWWVSLLSDWWVLAKLGPFTLQRSWAWACGGTLSVRCISPGEVLS